MANPPNHSDEMIKSAAIPTDDGRVFSGHRHCDILNTNAVRENGVVISSLKGGEQGFLTDQGLFLNREMAATHAIECGQIKALKFSKTKLFSEDIY